MVETEVAIAGYGDSYAHDENPRPAIELAAESTAKAIDDAGVDLDDIDAVITGRPPLSDQRPQWNNIFASYMNIPTEFSTEVTNHGAGVNGTLKHALAAIHGGFADTVLCVSADAASLFTDPVEGIPEIDIDREWESPYGPFMPSIYGMVAERYMHEHGITKEQMARVAVTSRKWAVRHPHAEMRDKGEITVEDVLSSRTIASPLNLLDCAPYGPGGTGGALVITEMTGPSNSTQTRSTSVVLANITHTKNSRTGLLSGTNHRIRTARISPQPAQSMQQTRRTRWQVSVRTTST
jgi:acetyl-CoA acetyltransferase